MIAMGEAGPGNDELIASIDDLLRRLPTYLAKGLPRDAAGRRHFGLGNANEDCIRSIGNLCFALATLQERVDGEPAGGDEGRRDRQALLHELLAYLCDSHRTGPGRTARGGEWGLGWQSSWWAAKAALGAQLAWGTLPPDLRESVVRMVEAEADRHLERDAPTGLFRDTKAEEIAWDAEILGVAINLLPDHPRVDAWRAKLVEFLANTFSSPFDRTSEDHLDGRPIKDLIYTCNIHGDFTLENHGAYHFCYVASPLLSKAWSHYAFLTRSEAPPEALFHNVRGVWDLASRTFLSKRFAYISGQDWARYTYGEYFIVPALAWLAGWCDGRDARRVLAARVRTLAEEAAGNDDGSFFGRRVTGGRRTGQMGKYETDCFACLALARMLLANAPPSPAREGEVEATPAVDQGPEAFHHASPESQTCFHRSERAFFSFSWSTLERPLPMLLLVPPDEDSLAEWRPGNGVAALQGPAAQDLHERFGVSTMRVGDGGALILGDHFLTGNHGKRTLSQQSRIEYDAGHARVRVQTKITARCRLGPIRVAGLSFAVPNDLFNDCRRVYHSDAGTEELRFETVRNPTRDLMKKVLPRRVDALAAKALFERDRKTSPGRRWINVDDRLGFVALNGARLRVRRPSRRQAPWSSLYYDVVEIDGRDFFPYVPAGRLLCDFEVLIHLGTAEETRTLAESPPAPARPPI